MKTDLKNILTIFAVALATASCDRDKNRYVEKLPTKPLFDTIELYYSPQEDEYLKLMHDDNCEYSSGGVILLGKYSRENNILRIVLPAMGASQVMYFEYSSEGPNGGIRKQNGAKLVTDDNLCLYRARTIVLALYDYTVAHQDNHPEQLEMLVPNYLSTTKLLTYPLSPTSKDVAYDYFPGNLTGSPYRVLLRSRYQNSEGHQVTVNFGSDIKFASKDEIDKLLKADEERKSQDRRDEERQGLKRTSALDSSGGSSSGAASPSPGGNKKAENSENILKKIWTEYDQSAGITRWAAADMELLEVAYQCEKDGDGFLSPKETAIYFGTIKLNAQRASVAAFYLDERGEPHSAAVMELPEGIIKLIADEDKLKGHPSSGGCWVEPVKWIDDSNLLVTAHSVLKGDGGYRVDDFRVVWNVRSGKCKQVEAYRSKEESITFNDAQSSPASSADSMNLETANLGNPANPESKTLYKHYSGSVGNLQAKWVLSLDKDGNVDGTYNYPSRKPNIRYQLKGKSAKEGYLALQEYTNGKVTSSLFLSKSMRNGKENWYGEMQNTDGKKFPVTISSD